MAYPKRTEFEKQAFIAKVFNLLKTHGKEVQYNNLEKVTDLDKKYDDALRYCREMGHKFEDVMGYSTPKSDLDIATSPTDGTEETTEKTRESEVSVSKMTAEEILSLHQNRPSRKASKYKQQNTIKQQKRERKKELSSKHYEILDWLQCIDDGIIKGNFIEAKRMIDTLDDYADRLHNMMDSLYVERAKKVYMQLMELENVLGKQDMEKIRKEVEAYAPINA